MPDWVGEAITLVVMCLVTYGYGYLCGRLRKGSR